MDAIFSVFKFFKTSLFHTQNQDVSSTVFSCQTKVVKHGEVSRQEILLSLLYNSMSPLCGSISFSIV